MKKKKKQLKRWISSMYTSIICPRYEEIKSQFVKKDLRLSIK